MQMTILLLLFLCRQFNTLVHGVPPNVRDALVEGDFSNVSEADIRNLNISVLEFIPPNVISKMNVTYLNPLVERLLQGNRPMALGRVMQAMGDKMDSNQLLDKVKQAGGMNDVRKRELIKTNLKSGFYRLKI